MTQISVDEVQPGLVGFLDQAMLHSGSSVEYTMPETTTRPGPFACVKVDGNNSWWVPLTTRPRTNSGYSRVHIPKKARSGIHPQWLNVEQYLYDGASIYFGPSSEFCAASYREVTQPAARSLISNEGLQRIQTELRHQIGRRERELSRAP